jgi:hypothetical protein
MGTAGASGKRSATDDNRGQVVEQKVGAERGTRGAQAVHHRNGTAAGQRPGLGEPGVSCSDRPERPACEASHRR